MEWISVEDMLPEIFVEVLVYATNISGDTHELGKKYLAIDCLVVWPSDHPTCFRADRYFGQVTHWMPLPLPPKE